VIQVFELKQIVKKRDESAAFSALCRVIHWGEDFGRPNPIAGK
jgi:hypothetical protein